MAPLAAASAAVPSIGSSRFHAFNHAFMRESEERAELQDKVISYGSGIREGRNQSGRAMNCQRIGDDIASIKTKLEELFREQANKLMSQVAQIIKRYSGQSHRMNANNAVIPDGRPLCRCYGWGFSGQTPYCSAFGFPVALSECRCAAGLVTLLLVGFCDRHRNPGSSAVDVAVHLC